MEDHYLPITQNTFNDLTTSQYIDFLNKNNNSILLGGALTDIELYHKKH